MSTTPEAFTKAPIPPPPAALSSQERAIKEGTKIVHGKVTDRVLRMFAAIRAYGPPRATLERAGHFTEAFRQN